MKSFLIIVGLFILLLFSCSKEEIKDEAPVEITYDITGEWIWKYTEGVYGFNDSVINPSSQEYNLKIRFLDIDTVIYKVEFDTGGVNIQPYMYTLTETKHFQTGDSIRNVNIFYNLDTTIIDPVTFTYTITQDILRMVRINYRNKEDHYFQKN